MHVAWMLLLLALSLAFTRPAQAADEAALKRVVARLSLAAAPWCGRSTTLLPDGRRVCTLRVGLFKSPVDTPVAAQLLDMVVISRGMLAGLSEDELAVVVGHEFAHLALAHGRLRSEAAIAAGGGPPAESRHLVRSMLESVGNPPHPEAPTVPREQESDADALGLLLAMRAGYQARAGAALFANDLLTRHAWSHAVGATHPPMPERSAALLARAQALCGVLARGGALMLPESRLEPQPDYRRDEALKATLPATDCGGLSLNVTEAHR